MSCRSVSPFIAKNLGSPAQEPRSRNRAKRGDEADRQRAPGGDEKRRVVRAMRGVACRADSTGQEAGRRPGESWMSRRSLAQRQQGGGERGGGKKRDALQANDGIGADEFLTPKGGRNNQKLRQIGHE